MKGTCFMLVLTTGWIHEAKAFPAAVGRVSSAQTGRSLSVQDFFIGERSTKSLTFSSQNAPTRFQSPPFRAAASNLFNEPDAFSAVQLVLSPHEYGEQGNYR